MWPTVSVPLQRLDLGFTLDNVVLYLYKDSWVSLLLLDVLAVNLIDFIYFANIWC